MSSIKYSINQSFFSHGQGIVAAAKPYFAKQSMERVRRGTAKSPVYTGLSKKKWAALIILNLQENSNLLKFKYEQRRKR